MPEEEPTRVNPAAAPDLIVRGRRVILPTGEQPAAIHIREGRITEVSAFDDFPPRSPVHDAGDSVVMPGVVDTHVHINEPGRTDWEGFSTATRAAAAGGITSLIDMPLNSIPATTTLSAYREKLAASAGKLWVDVGFWGGVVPDNATELESLWEAGVFGLKCFLVPSGVEEFQHVSETELRASLPILAKLGAPLLVHAELPGPIEDAMRRFPKSSPAKYHTWLASRPRAAENEALALLLRLCREFGARIHIVHLSSSDMIPALRQAKTEKLPVSVESCPHYLQFASEEIPDGATEFKCAPPVRERENREKLWKALDEGLIDFVVTDHSPCPPAMKVREKGDFLAAWGGIASLELSLPALWTEARSRGYAVRRLTDWLSMGPARLAGLTGRKGAIVAGGDADIVIWNPSAKFRVESAKLQHRHKLTPYAGRELAGAVETTFLRGRKIFDRGEFLAAPTGQILRRTSP